MPANMNDPLPWSDFDVVDLKFMIEHGESLEKTAGFLSRSVEQVRAKAIELDLLREEKRSWPRPVATAEPN